jgi:hypothetical protein
MPKGKEVEVETIDLPDENVREEQSGELEVYEAEIATRPAGNLFGTIDDPEGTVEKATRHATALARVVQEQGLFTSISGKKHVRVEGWTLLGSMVGVFPVLVSCDPCFVADKEDPAGTSMVRGYEAVVEAHTLNGAVVGKAKAYCLRNEKRWRAADDYAVASMAQTRATSKALRLPLGFIMQLAGYNPTPAEEMPAQVAAPRRERMLRRVEDLCIEIDTGQERARGHTWSVATEQSKLQFEKEIPSLTEEDLAALGLGLSRFAAQVKGGEKEAEFELLGGDVMFAEASDLDPYA